MRRRLRALRLRRGSNRDDRQEDEVRAHSSTLSGRDSPSDGTAAGSVGGQDGVELLTAGTGGNHEEGKRQGHNDRVHTIDIARAADWSANRLCRGAIATGAGLHANAGPAAARITTSTGPAQGTAPAL